MRSVILATSVAVGLSGCAAFQALETASNATVSPQSVLVAANAFDAAETIATGYLSLPLCGPTAPVTCRSAAAAAKIIPAARSGQKARDNLEGLLKAANGGPVPVASYNTLEAAVSTLQNVYTQYGIK
jgi:hypothetical protein